MTRENKMVELLQQENTSEVGKEDENLILLLLSSDLRDRYMKTLAPDLTETSNGFCKSPNFFLVFFSIFFNSFSIFLIILLGNFFLFL